jgi:hypothetical protein
MAPAATPSGPNDVFTLYPLNLQSFPKKQILRARSCGGKIFLCRKSLRKFFCRGQKESHLVKGETTHP